MLLVGLHGAVAAFDVIRHEFNYVRLYKLWYVIPLVQCVKTVLVHRCPILRKDWNDHLFDVVVLIYVKVEKQFCKSSSHLIWKVFIPSTVKDAFERENVQEGAHTSDVPFIAECTTELKEGQEIKIISFDSIFDAELLELFKLNPLIDVIVDNMNFVSSESSLPNRHDESLLIRFIINKELHDDVLVLCNCFISADT